MWWMGGHISVGYALQCKKRGGGVVMNQDKLKKELAYLAMLATSSSRRHNKPNIQINCNTTRSSVPAFTYIGLSTLAPLPPQPPPISINEEPKLWTWRCAHAWSLWPAHKLHHRCSSHWHWPTVLSIFISFESNCEAGNWEEEELSRYLFGAEETLYTICLWHVRASGWRSKSLQQTDWIKIGKEVEVPILGYDKIYQHLD